MPQINNNQIIWNGTATSASSDTAKAIGVKNKTGFVYRTIDLANMFPEGKDHSNTNWSYETNKSKQTADDKLIEAVVRNITNSSDTIFVKPVNFDSF